MSSSNFITKRVNHRPLGNDVSLSNSQYPFGRRRAESTPVRNAISNLPYFAIVRNLVLDILAKKQVL